MKLQRVVLPVSAACLLIGLALIMGGSYPAWGAASVETKPAFALAGPSPELQCNVKVPNGLAQCGSQASSCKNCHEVKGEDPVNAQGDWHISHAFGDFCEFCHGGNVQAIDKNAAHQGLLAPLGDVQTNCSACHADYAAKAEPYAVALGVTIETSNGGSSELPSQPPDSNPPAQPTPAPTPTSGAMVDYVAQYRAEYPEPLSAGTIVTGFLLGLTVVGGGSFVVWNEKRLRQVNPPSSNLQSTPASREIRDWRLEISGELSPELAELLPLLQQLDPETLRALRTLLSHHRIEA
ncbi:MAG TPA: hypothetical protein VJG32_23105 [Anaerolineae bacterium]|nr:hypothetical protein [Anaerolineae bacterium]